MPDAARSAAHRPQSVNARASGWAAPAPGSKALRRGGDRSTANRLTDSLPEVAQYPSCGRRAWTGALKIIPPKRPQWKMAMDLDRRLLLHEGTSR